MKNHRNIPFFVPHAGCPNCCVFCSQTKITGRECEKNRDQEIFELRSVLESESGDFCESQIAFFGGSFTAIERDRMVGLLSVANEYIKKGVASSIRISTRPDKINDEILDILREYNVKNVELGVQSTEDSVLDACERGHKSIDSFLAAELIIKKGFVFGGQMMIGLPGSSIETEIKTAENIVAMGAKEARIYPTVVFEGTKLFEMAKKGEYSPLSLDEAVERSAKCFRIFYENGVKVLRIGLHSSENLKNAPLGANHPALGELVKSCVYTDIIVEKVGRADGKIIEIGIKKSDLSMLCGHNKTAINRIKAKTNAHDVEVYPSGCDSFCPSIKIRSV